MNFKPINPEVKKYLKYEPDTGIIRWIKKPCDRIVVGAIFGSSSDQRYIQGRFKGQRLYAHRLAWYLHTGIDPLEKTIDHKDGNGLDNRLSNLRLAISFDEQIMNTGALGYTWSKKLKLFAAHYGGKGREKSLGHSECPLIARIKYHDHVSDLYPQLKIPFVPRGKIKGRPEGALFTAYERTCRALGYYWVKARQCFQSQSISDEGKTIYLGGHDCPLLARMAFVEYNRTRYGVPIPLVPNCSILGRPTSLS